MRVSTSKYQFFMIYHYSVDVTKKATLWEQPTVNYFVKNILLSRSWLLRALSEADAWLL